MELVDHQFGVGQILSKGTLEGSPHIRTDPFHFVSIRQILEEGLQVLLSTMLQHIKDVVGCQIGDYTAIPAGKVHFVDTHDDRGFVTNGLGEFLNEIVSDVLDGVHTGLLG